MKYHSLCAKQKQQQTQNKYMSNAHSGCPVLLENDLHDNVGYNPWVGRTITGWPPHVILRGQTIVQDGTFHGTAGAGNWIDRPTLATQPKGVA